MGNRIRTKRIDDCIWLMDDNGQATGYLVCGGKRAAVIDTMNGIEDVHAVVRGITDLPLVVVNTHGHCDHIFGNIYFDCDCFLHPDDAEIAAEHTGFPMFRKLCAEKKLEMPPFKPINDGDVIDLGGLTLEAISLPGHTPGGICLLLREKRVLFTGDSINHHLWMQLDESLPLRVFLENLDRISWVTGKADRILHGHAQDFDDISLFDDLRSGVGELIRTRGMGETRRSTDYKWFRGIAKQYPFDGDGSVIVYSEVKLD
ncbi:MAG TPA: MBL fold metallo-hydrolase [Clostridiales bacterium]|mgnify:FL=1|nr:MBL fold metallo-hydrolase [Clostridiales bacterium]